MENLRKYEREKKDEGEKKTMKEKREPTYPHTLHGP
jgi:hypothetical protein